MRTADLITFPVVLRRLTVARVSDPSPRMRRVTLTGEHLAAFHRDGLDLPAFVTESFDDHIKVLFPGPGQTEADLPVQHRSGIDWPHSSARISRDYTPRRFDPVARELDLDFVLHGHGPAATWARRAEPGDVVHCVGPKSSLVLPSDVDSVLLVGDETALPAIGRFLDERPVAGPIRVVLEIRQEGADEYPLNVEGDVEVTWLRTPPGAPSVLAEHVMAAHWPEGTPFLWCGGEAGALKPLRRWCTYTRGLAKRHVNITGYWRAPVPRADGEQPAVAANVNDHGHELSPLELLLDPMPTFAVRAAVSTGLLTAVAGGPTPPRELAALAGLGAEAASLFTRYLASVDVLAIGDDGLVRLGGLGEDLLDDRFLVRRLDDRHVDGMVDAALHRLTESLRTGASAFALAHGATMSATLAADHERLERVSDGMGWSFAYLAEGIVASPAWRDGERLRLTGPGSAVVAQAVHGTRPGTPMVVQEGPVVVSVLENALADGGAREAVTIVPQGEPVEADATVCALALGRMNDGEAVALLASLTGASYGRRVLLVETAEDDEPDDREELTSAMRHWAATGSPPRSTVDLTALADRAGFDVGDVHRLGWGHLVVELTAR
ncbi:siderophore-interacting protein [Prauserella cavernicola]|uniref:Siderophore-interacting protein n=1 Tax=Prauserella cavernicola TaxID=2800127 RepID=A0A934QPR5_9PSEU|nr:siderophore-interacting protein [Prauserella cavernicola]MBK1783164.1 siderophore-interacting protein [Prauserella cavernicola]